MWISDSARNGSISDFLLFLHTSDHEYHHIALFISIVPRAASMLDVNATGRRELSFGKERLRSPKAWPR